MTSSPRPLGGMAIQKLPGSTPKIHKPHPPSKIPPPGIRSRLVHMKRPEHHNNSPERANYMGLTNRDSSKFDEQQPYPKTCSQNTQGRNTRQLRSRNGLKSGSHLEANTTDGTPNEEELELLQKLALGGNRIGSLQR